jgi:hypothetical protein
MTNLIETKVNHYEKVQIYYDLLNLTEKVKFFFIIIGNL